MARNGNAAPAADAAEKPARKKRSAAARKASAAKAAATRAARKAEANGDQASAPAAKPAAKPAAPVLRELGTQAVIDESNERGKIIARAEYLHHGGVAQYLLAYTRADGCYDERWFAAGQLVDYVERRKR
jgi:hypothetical protein